MKNGTCLWTDINDGDYETSCGKDFILNSGTLEDNKIFYCCFCGKKIEDGNKDKGKK